MRCSSNDNCQIVHSANLQVSILSFCARHFANGYHSQLPLEMPIQRRRPLCSRLIYKYSLEAFVLILSLKTTTWDFRWKCTSKDNHQFVRQSTLQVVIGVKWQNYRDKVQPRLDRANQLKKQQLEKIHTPQTDQEKVGPKTGKPLIGYWTVCETFVQQREDRALHTPQ